MYAIRAALKSVPLFYVHLADYEPPIIPTQKVKQKSRTRQVDELNELSIFELSSNHAHEFGRGYLFIQKGILSIFHFFASWFV